MLHPALLQIAARDRIAEMQRAGAKRSFGTWSYRATEPPAPGHSARDARRVHPQRAIGWFLVSLGLRLAVPRTRPGSGR